MHILSYLVLLTSAPRVELAAVPSAATRGVVLYSRSGGLTPQLVALALRLRDGSGGEGSGAGCALPDSYEEL